MDKAVSLVRGIERERLRTVEVSRAKRIILDYLQHRPKEVSPAEILRRTAVDSPFSPGTFEFALKALVAKGHVEVLSPSRYRLSPKIGRVAETEWRGDSWYVRLEGSEDWIREDELEPVDDSAPECE